MQDGHPSLLVASSLGHALDALAERVAEGAAFAGGTWIMRAPLRHEMATPAYVALGRIAELKRIEIGAREISIGATVTHAALAVALQGLPDLAALAQAAGRSANPAIRAAATVGGNIATADFAAADLVPALLCLDAQVELASREGTERLGLADYLGQRRTIGPERLLSRIIVPRSGARSAHARLPLRKAGDYPVAIVSLSLERSADGRIRLARIALGSVGLVARRWTELETDLAGRPFDPVDLARRAEAATAGMVGRDGVEAEGWYRVAVLPALLRRAAEALAGTERAAA